MERTIKPEAFITATDESMMVLDIRRDSDYETSGEVVPGSTWKDPTKIDDWIDSVPKDASVVIYCVRGGGVSNSVLDRLQADGINARFIEGGIEALKEAGGTVEQK